MIVKVVYLRRLRQRFAPEDSTMETAIFLSYAREDRRPVQNIYRRLRDAGLEPWMDQPPRPWQLEGIRPGEDWDAAIRTRLSQARIVLACLSRRAISKSGYIQRELRLALNFAMERPPNTVSLIPVLLEPCEPPDLKVETISLRQLQWYRLYESGLAALVEYLLRNLPSVRGSGIQVSASPATPSAAESLAIAGFIDSVRVLRKPEHGQPISPAEAVFQAIGRSFGGALDQLGRGCWALESPWVELDLRIATSALLQVREPHIATALATIAANHCRHRIGARTVNLLRVWLDHPVPEVGALAALLICDRRSDKSVALDWLARYASRPNRLHGFAMLLRNFLGSEALVAMARSVPSLVWETVANDPHFGGMGQTHIPMRDPGGRFAFLLSHPSWQAREVGAAIYAGDHSIPLEAKLSLLKDQEPRVRFRALEGILLNLHDRENTAEPVLQHLKIDTSMKNEGRAWTVEETRGVPRLVTVLCSDDRVERIPGDRTGGFGHTGLWDVFEWLDPAHFSLSALAVIYPNSEFADYLQREEAAYSRLGRKKGHWAFRAASAGGLARVEQVRNLCRSKGGAA